MLIGPPIRLGIFVIAEEATPFDKAKIDPHQRIVIKVAAFVATRKSSFMVSISNVFSQLQASTQEFVRSKNVHGGEESITSMTVICNTIATGQ